ncbi:MAG: SRPBCC family protein [Pedobacter sp.]|nr:SRPBCC family protein [Pedobacter sp.]
MKTYRLEFSQKVPIDIDEAWDFFSSPLNLSKVTPSSMAFDVTTPNIEHTKMYPGLIITYKVSPLLGIKLDWVTEITHVREKEYCIDEQRFGPFAFWNHNHRFEKIEGGTIIHDLLHYSVGFGPIGRLANAISVHNKIQEIFDFRFKKVEELFGVMK